MKKLLFCFVVLLVSAFNTQLVQAQFDENFTLLGEFEFESDLSDIWGYESDGNEYAIVGRNNGTSIIDISDPANPVEVVDIPGGNSTWRDMKVWGDYAYVVDDQAGESLLIIDMSNLPESYDYQYWDGNDTLSFETVHNIFMDENGIAYLFGANYQNGGAIMLDVTQDPWEPEVVGLYDTHYIHDGYVRNDTLWAGEINDGLLSVIDISDKMNPVTLGSTETPNNFTHNCWLSDDGNTIFTTDEVSGAYITAYDVSDVNNITEIDKIQSSPGEGVIPHNTFVKGNFLVTAYYRDGVTIHDATYPDNLIQVGSFDTSPLEGNGFNGAWGVYPYFESGKIIVSDIEEGLFIFDIVYEQAALLEGNVVDGDTGDPLFNVNVSIVGTPQTDNTNLFGQYKTGAAHAGTYDILFSKTNYESVLVEGYELTTGEISILDMEMFSSCGNEICEGEFGENYCECEGDCPCSFPITFFQFNEETFDYEESAEPIAYCASNFWVGGEPNPDPATIYIPMFVNGLECVGSYEVATTDGSIVVRTEEGLVDTTSVNYLELIFLAINQDDFDSIGETTTVTVFNEDNGCLEEISIEWADFTELDDLSEICQPAFCGDESCDEGESWCDCEADCPCDMPTVYLEFTGSDADESDKPVIACTTDFSFILPGNGLNPDPAVGYMLIGFGFEAFPCVDEFIITSTEGTVLGLNPNFNLVPYESFPTNNPQAPNVMALSFTQEDIDNAVDGITTLSVAMGKGGCESTFDIDWSLADGADSLIDLCPAAFSCEDFPYTNDVCSEATPITTLDGENGPFSNLCADTDENDPVIDSETTCWVDGSQEEPGAYENTIWFSFTGDGGIYSFETFTYTDSEEVQNDDTQMQLYTGGCDNLVAITEACNDDISDSNYLSLIENFQTEEGVDYILLVDGWDGTAGEFGIRFTPTPEDTTGVAIQDITALNNQLSCYPVPAQNQANIVYNSITQGAISIQLYNLNGQLIETINEQAMEGKNQYSLDISNYASGTYFVQLNNGQSITSTRLVKAK